MIKKQHYRRAAQTTEYAITLSIIMVVCIAVIQTVVSKTSKLQTLWDLFTLAGWVEIFQIVGYVILILGALSILVILLSNASTLWEKRRERRKRRELDRLQRASPTAGGKPTPANVLMALKALPDADEEIRHHAMNNIYKYARSHPGLTDPLRGARRSIEKALLEQVGFYRAVEGASNQVSLPQLVTLGAKCGAGTVEKRIAPATSDPATLARWLFIHRAGARHQEVQVSIGYDTSLLPGQSERARFLALYLYIATTDLAHFQALTRRPTRDPNAAYGLLIRGDRVDVKFPGQASRRRLDYIFNLPVISETNLAEFLRELQLLNLGMLLAVVEETFRTFYPRELPASFPIQGHRLAQAYRGFEQRFVAHLRHYDQYRDPGEIYLLQNDDHRERRRAFCNHRLEECLYPKYNWVVPLYGADLSWDKLLAPLRAIEGMLLHQGRVEERETTRGARFIHDTRLLGHRTAEEIQEFLDLKESVPSAPLHAWHVDPFIDGKNEDATTEYLQGMTRLLNNGEIQPDQLPDPHTFAQARGYYLPEFAPSRFDP